MSKHSSTLEALKQIVDSKTALFRMTQHGPAPRDEHSQRIGELSAACAWLKINNPGAWAAIRKGKHVNIRNVATVINQLERNA